MNSNDSDVRLQRISDSDAVVGKVDLPYRERGCLDIAKREFFVRSQGMTLE